MPLVDREEAVGSDSDDGRCSETGLGVRGYVGHRRVGWELQHHDDILLHLLGEHQRGLQEEILFRRVDDGMQGGERTRAETWSGGRNKCKKKIGEAAKAGEEESEGKRKGDLDI